MINKIIHKLKSYFNKDARNLAVLSKKDRYTEGYFHSSYTNFKFSFPDCKSFVFTYDEIFNKGIYRFKSESENPYIIDGGSNIGVSVAFFKYIYPKSKIIAFEPDIKINSYLVDNITKNGFKDVKVINKALWNKNEIIHFLSEGSDSNRVIQNANNTEGIHTIKGIKLSEFIDKKVDLLKLDIEGSEGLVLSEIQSKLKLVDNIFIEYHSMIDSEQNLDLILSLLTKNSFRYYIESPIKMRKYPFIDYNKFQNFDGFLNIYAKKINQ